MNDGDSDGDDLMDEDHVNDCGDNEHVYDGGDDDVIFNGRDEDRQPTRDRYSEMLSISKQLWSYLENCDDEYYQQVKKPNGATSTRRMCSCDCPNKVNQQ